MYQTQVDGDWVTLSKDTYRYFQHTSHRCKFIPFMWLKRLIKEIRS